MFSRTLQRMATVLVALGSLILAGTGMATLAANQAASSLQPLIVVGPVIPRSPTQTPPTSAFCLATFGIAYYGPSDIYAMSTT